MVAPGKADKAKHAVYHEDELKRGWRLVHQKLAAQVDLTAHSIRGTATFSLRALNTDCTNVCVNLRRARVLSCHVNDVDATFDYNSPLDDKLLLDAVATDAEPHRNEDVKRECDTLRTWSTDWGELNVAVPSDVRRALSRELFMSTQEADATVTSEAQVPHVPIAPLHKLPSFKVSIEYELREPVGGASFFGSPDPERAISDPQFMITESRYGLVRAWMPCMDSLRWCDRCFFDMDIIVGSGQTAVASGDLTNTVLLDNGRVEYQFRATVPAHAREINLAVGYFACYPDPNLPKSVTHLCLQGKMKELIHTSPPLFTKALAFCRDYFGFDPPCTSFKLLFVGPLGNDPHVNRCAGGGLAILDGNLLHDRPNIDAGYRAREQVMSTLVQSYIGCLLRPRTAEDAWIISGLCSHVTNLGLRSAFFGNNWYRFRIMDEMEALYDEKPQDSVKLAEVDSSIQLDITSQNVRRRALAVVYMIERRIGSDIMRRAMRDIVAECRNGIVALSEQLEHCFDSVRGEIMHASVVKAFHSTPNSLELQKTESIADDDDDEVMGPGASKRLGSSGASGGYDDGLLGISVHHFLKRLRAICGTDVRNLARQWAPSIGVHRLRFAYRYNARRHIVEFVAVQETVDDGVLRGKPSLPFVGTINVRVMEVEGAAEHQVDIREASFQTDLSLMSRRTKKSSLADKDAQYDPLKWTPVSFVRVDPDQEWCMEVRLEPPENMLITMLQSDRDAIGQYRACRELARSENPEAARALAGVLEDKQVYWRVQAEAANSLATCKGGLELLLAFCRRHYTDRGTDGRENVKRNDFSDFSNYFVKRAVVSAIVKAKESVSSTLLRARIRPDAVNLTLDLLKGNDNAGNIYYDDEYVADLLRAVGSVAIHSVDDLPGPASSKAGETCTSVSATTIHHIERFVALDRLMPGTTGAVTCALLRTLSEFQVVRLGTLERRAHGTPMQDLVRGVHKPDRTLARLIERHCRPDAALCVRIEAMRAFGLVYSGDLSICQWLLARVDKNASDAQLIDVAFGDMRDNLDVCESPAVRLAVMDALNDAVTTRLWGRGRNPPLVTALRRNTRCAKAICVRIRKLLVADIDVRIRDSAWSFASVVWGLGAPVCFLGRVEYQEAMKLVAKTTDKTALRRPVVPEQSRSRTTRIWVTKKPSKTKNGKNAKSARASIGAQAVSGPPNDTPKAPISVVPPPTPAKVGKVVISKPAQTETKISKESSQATGTVPKVKLGRSTLGKFGSRPSEQSKSEMDKYDHIDIDDEDLENLRRAYDQQERERRRNERKQTDRITPLKPNAPTQMTAGTSSLSRLGASRDTPSQPSIHRGSSSGGGGDGIVNGGVVEPRKVTVAGIFPDAAATSAEHGEKKREKKKKDKDKKRDKKDKEERKRDKEARRKRKEEKRKRREMEGREDGERPKKKHKDTFPGSGELTAP